MEAEAIREQMHVPEIPDPPSLLDQRTYRLDEPGDTVTVDHINKADQWVRPDGYLNHSDAVERGSKIDGRALARVADAAAHFEPDFETYMPTCADIDNMPKYARSGFQCTRGRNRNSGGEGREGKLPVFLQMKYDGVLQSKNNRQIEWEQLQHDRRIDARVNRRTGWVR